MVAPRRQRVTELTSFDPSPPFRELLTERNPLVLVRAANRVGKTRHACYLVARYMVDHPGARCRVVGPSRAQVREVMARYLNEFLGPYLAPGSRYYPGTGWNRNNTIHTRNGSICQVRSYQDDPDTQEGDELDLIVLDELPPKAHLEANLGRIADRKGQIIVCFTVQTQDPARVERFRKAIEGFEVSPVDGRTVHESGWVQFVVPHTRENVPWKDEETFERQVGKYRGTDQEATRVNGSWSGPNDERKFQGWEQRMVLDTDGIMQRVRALMGGKFRADEYLYGIDHGTGIGKQRQYLIFRCRDEYFVLHEYIGGGATTPTDNAQGIKDAVEAWLGAGKEGLVRLHRIIGDVNSAGPLGAGRSLNWHTERALAKLYGLQRSPIEIETPTKDQGFRDAREVTINHAMLERRWWVHESCEGAIRAFQEYRGGNNDPFKDSIDAIGYAVTDSMLTETLDPVALRR